MSFNDFVKSTAIVCTNGIILQMTGIISNINKVGIILVSIVCCIFVTNFINKLKMLGD